VSSRDTTDVECDQLAAMIVGEFPCSFSDPGRKIDVRGDMPSASETNCRLGAPSVVTADSRFEPTPVTQRTVAPRLGGFVLD
jgi:hypothetical protein